MKFLFNSLLVITLCSCSSVTYVEPSTGPLAKITFFNLTSLEYGVVIFKNHETCKEIVGVSPPKSNTVPFTTNIVADKPLSFIMGFSAGYNYCSIVATFSPEKGKEYSAVLSRVADGCILTLTEKNGTESKPVGWEKRKPVPRLTNNSSFCE